MSSSRPKHRVLVRWNDDLDKSLLLFIAHTCTDMGIRIPYDEVARRMGSTFSEGAIIQHISKLRTKMAELNAAPVPPPTKRGSVTTRPSAVYAQRNAQTDLLLPAPPAPHLPPPKTRGRGKKASAKRASTRIKRSDSDVGEDQEEDWDLSSDIEADLVASPRKRRRTIRTPSHGLTMSKGNATYADTPEARKIRETLNARDEQFQQEQRQIEDDLVDQVEGLLHQSVEQGTRQHVNSLTHVLSNEEMYEPIEPHVHLLAQSNVATPTGYQQNEESVLDVPLSPKSQLPVLEPERAVTGHRNEFGGLSGTNFFNTPTHLFPQDLESFEYGLADVIGTRHTLPRLRTDLLRIPSAFSSENIHDPSAVTFREESRMHDVAAYAFRGTETPKTSNSFSTDASSTRLSLTQDFSSTPIPIDFATGLPDYEPLPDLPFDEASEFGGRRGTSSPQFDFSGIMDNVMI